jgi:hypothetical protein
MTTIRSDAVAKFIISYLGGNNPDSPESAAVHMSQYKAWLEALGARAISPANPFKETHTITSDGNVMKGSGTGMSGFTIIEAQDINQAIIDAQTCPFLSIDGTLEVSQLVDMNSC